MSTFNHVNSTSSSVITDQLTLNGKSVNGITNEIINESDKIPTSQAIYLAVHGLIDIVDKIKQEMISKVDTSVITESTIDPLFKISDGWISGGNFTLVNKMAVFDNTVGSSDPDHFIIIPKTAFPSPDRYILSIHVSELNRCQLTVLDKDEQVIKVIDKAGVYHVEVVTVPLVNNTFKIKAVQFDTDGYAKLTKCAVYLIRAKFYDYLTSKLSEIAHIDTSGYVTGSQLKVLLAEVKKDYLDKINQVVKGFNQYITNYSKHTHTPDQCGAAPVVHSHTPEEVGAAPLSHIHEPSQCGAAPVIHSHDNYADKGEIDQLLDDLIDKKRNLLPTTSSQTIMSGPVGVIPPKYHLAGIDEPTPILLPSVIHVDDDGIGDAFDSNFGYVVSSDNSVENIAHFVSVTTNDLVTFKKKGTFVHVYFNVPRNIKGYTIVGEDISNNPTDWEIYKDLGEHIHNATIAADSSTVTLTFANPIYFRVFSIKFTEAKVNNFKAKILFEFEDTVQDRIYLSYLPVKVSLASHGGTVNSHLDLLKCDFVPTYPILNLPVHVFATFEGNEHVGFHDTFLLPEVGKRRNGVDITTGKFTSVTPTNEGYHHPAYGTLKVDKSTDISKALDICNQEDFVEVNGSELDIIHVPIHPLMLVGYQLTIDRADNLKVPHWHLEVVTFNQDNEERTVSIDTVLVGEGLSSDTYIMKLHEPMKVKEVKLALRTDKAGFKVKGFVPLYSDVFYCPTTNTMYLKDEPKEMIYIGSYKKIKDVVNDKFGYVVTSTVTGNSVTIPVNGLNITKKNTKYKVMNPYFTDLITVIPRVAGEPGKPVSNLEIVSITPYEIEVMATAANVFVLDITRDW